MSLKTFTLGACAAVVVLAALAPRVADAQSEGASKDSGKAALTVSLAAPSEARIPSEVAATGSAVAREVVSVAPEVGGVAVVEVLVEENDRVEAGQVLARLDVRVAKAEAARQRAAVAEAEASVLSARANAERGALLLGAKSLSREANEERQTALGVAEARVDQARAALEILEVRISQAEVRSPVDGRVASRTAVKGSMQQAGAEMFTVDLGGLVEVDARIPERAIARIEQGMKASVTGPSGEAEQGTVRLVGARVDPETRLGSVRIALPEGSALKPGMFARATVTLGEQTALTVSETDVVWMFGKPNVYVVADGRAKLREIVSGGRKGGRMAVASGLAATDRIVTAGAGFLNDGDVVAVAPAADAAK